MIKTTGLELKKFIRDSEYWPVGSWYEYVEFYINGITFEDAGIEECLEDEDIVKFSGGEVSDKSGYIADFEQFFKTWRKKQATSTILVECDKEKQASVIDAIKSAGGKVILK